MTIFDNESVFEKNPIFEKGLLVKTEPLFGPSSGHGAVLFAGEARISGNAVVYGKEIL